MLNPSPTTPHQNYDLGPHVDEHYAFLHHIIDHHVAPDSIALEFGVGSGTSLRLIAEHMPVIGFDSFQGLPEDWRAGYPKGAFANKPPIVANSHLVIGLYNDTLPQFRWDSTRRIGLVHLDADLYSSTRTILQHLPWEDLRRAHTVFVFDEWHGYDGAELHEQRAWREHADATGIRWEVIGSSFQQWGIRLA